MKLAILLMVIGTLGCESGVGLKTCVTLAEMALNERNAANALFTACEVQRVNFENFSKQCALERTELRTLLETTKEE